MRSPLRRPEPETFSLQIQAKRSKIALLDFRRQLVAKPLADGIKNFACTLDIDLIGNLHPAAEIRARWWRAGDPADRGHRLSDCRSDRAPRLLPRPAGCPWPASSGSSCPRRPAAGLKGTALITKRLAGLPPCCRLPAASPMASPASPKPSDGLMPMPSRSRCNCPNASCSCCWLRPSAPSISSSD
jgi:hypothetical protein